MTEEIEISLNVKHAMILVFALGISVGFLTGSIVSGQITGKATVQPTGNSDNNPSPSPSGGDSGVTVSFETTGEPVIGQEDAPVTIAYWGDFQCPFCKRFEQRTFPQLKNNYISEGKVRFVFKDFQFLGPDSTTAGIASECVWKQVGESNPEAYWNWHASMFDNQDGENSGWGDKQDIISMTRQVSGVNANQLSSCMENNRQKFQDEIERDRSEGRSVGITGTPGFVIYRTGSDTGQQITGAQPYSRFRSVINRVQNSDSGTETTGRNEQVDKTIQVSGTEYSFSPSTIQVKKGQTVKVEFRNTGSIPHNLRIPSLGVGSRVIQAGQTDSFTFIAPKSGTFPISFECSLPGHAANGMTGKITPG
ncbi:thioredoxin domain-containing protein [Candidatus Nanohaloarchaea archaeon]|nr:thioredoxin domain-containing protein [Candidatus Nanohaloarchaea archaeon]